MQTFFLTINSWMTAHRRLAVAGFLVLVVVMVALAMRVSYEEDIARFLPAGDEHQDYQQAVSMLNSQNRIVVCFDGPADSVKQAMDAFALHVTEVDTAGVIADLQVTIDETRLLDVIGFITRNAPYFLSTADYRRMDSLLATPGFVATQLEADKQSLLLPAAGTALQTLADDPLRLFSPLMERLQALGHNSHFTVSDGYVFTSDLRHGLAFLSSPYGVSESALNARLVSMLRQASALTMEECPQVRVSAIGAPLIAVGNAAQIKRDAFLAVALSVVLILTLLVWHYRRLSYLLWIAASLAFGWLFALAGMSLLRDSISIIVLGIGSVIIGIAVNYPLHFLDHLRETGDRRQTLRDMVHPLLVGNITTVSAFLCLLWLDAAAIRDLGLFAALMLTGTILFVLTGATPKPTPKPTPCPSPREGSPKSLACIAPLPWGGVGGGLGGGLLVGLLTLLLFYFSLQTSFDSDLRHINYMTDAQRQDLQLLASLSEDMPHDMVSLIPSEEVQRERLQLWDDFCQRHPLLADSLRLEAGRQGFAPNAFTPFETLLSASPKAQPADYFQPVTQFLGTRHLINARQAGSQLVTILQDSFNYVSLVCGFVVFAFLWLSFGRIELALLSFLPLAVSWVWILGLMQLFGLQFNIVNIILATFIFGQGDDYTIFITEGLVYEHTTGRQRLRSYRRSVVLSAVIMFIGIGTLILARHPALRSLGQVTVVGMATVVFMACYIPPAVFRWLTRHRCTVDDAQCTADEARCTVASKLPITLGRVVRSLFAMGFFLVMMYLFLLPYTWLRFHLCQMTDGRRIGYHRLLQRMAAFVIRHVPGVSFHLDNSVGETFRQPSVIIANHQSHLDLMCLMMLTPRLVFLTNDWVWHNPFYGMVIHRAEFVPVSDGIEANIDRLRALYRRGYSICVFPEGTRSADCSIQRFHQGAFYLARQLGADILPVYLHGPGHVLPKRDFLLRPGRIDVEVGHRLTVDEPLLAFTRSMRHHYQSHYAALCQRIETPAYWRPYRHLLNYYKSPHIR